MIKSNIRYKNNITFHNNNPIRRSIDPSPDRSKTYISLTTTPARFYTDTTNDEFINVLTTLSSQTVPADKIFVSLCSEYKRRFTAPEYDNRRLDRISRIKSRFSNVEIIETIDYGPATKLLGLLEYDKRHPFFKENDLIIVVDDDHLYSRDLVWSHVTGFNIYNADVIAIDQAFMIRSLNPYTFNVTNKLYNDNYQGFLYGWLSFSIRFRSTYDIFSFYKDITVRYPDIIFHDDLFFTLYVHQHKLYTIESRFIPLQHDIKNDRALRDLYRVDPEIIDRTINRTDVASNSRTGLDSIDALRDQPLPSNSSRSQLEELVFDYYKIPVSKPQRSFIDRETVYRISKHINPRSFYISSISGLELIRLPEDLHVVFNYVDPSQMLVTVTVFDEGLVAESGYDIVFLLNDIRYTMTVFVDRIGTNIATKFSHMIGISPEHNLRLVKTINPNIYNYSIIQTSPTQTMSKKKYYSISTILTTSVDYPYRFFDDKDVLDFVKTHFSQLIVDAINNLVPGAYVADIFRYCYLYLYGGIYIDCKKIVYISFTDYIKRFVHYTHNMHNIHNTLEIFVKDIPPGMTYNAVIVSDRLSKTIKLTLMYAVFMIVNNLYTEDPLNITGPGCLGDAIRYVYKNNSYPYFYKNTVEPNRSSEFSYIVDLTGYNVIKNTYYGYYDEDNYYNLRHYHLLWKDRKIYKQDLSLIYPDITRVSDVTLFR